MRPFIFSTLSTFVNVLLTTSAINFFSVSFSARVMPPFSDTVIPDGKLLLSSLINNFISSEGATSAVSCIDVCAEGKSLVGCPVKPVFKAANVANPIKSAQFFLFFPNLFFQFVNFFKLIA